MERRPARITPKTIQQQLLNNNNNVTNTTIDGGWSWEASIGNYEGYEWMNWAQIFETLMDRSKHGKQWRRVFVFFLHVSLLLLLDLFVYIKRKLIKHSRKITSHVRYIKILSTIWIVLILTFDFITHYFKCSLGTCVTRHADRPMTVYV